MACILTIYLDSSNFSTLIVYKPYISLCIQHLVSGIFCDKKETKGMMEKTERVTK